LTLYACLRVGLFRSLVVVFENPVLYRLLLRCVFFAVCLILRRQVLGNAGASDAGSAAETAARGGGGEAAAAIDTGVGKYSLLAVISHIGKGTDHGHYVCHILKEGAWVLYNDEKVSKCSPICGCRCGCVCILWMGWGLLLLL
jgi:hypothetical protein